MCHAEITLLKSFFVTFLIDSSLRYCFVYDNKFFYCFLGGPGVDMCHAEESFFFQSRFSEKKSIFSARVDDAERFFQQTCVADSTYLGVPKCVQLFKNCSKIGP